MALQKMKEPLFAIGLLIAQVAEPTGTLTLGCEGMETVTHAKAVSPSMVINFATKTITGLDAPSNSSIKIISMDGATIHFSGGSPEWKIDGDINRVTGYLYALKSCPNRACVPSSLVLACKPTQRMF
jgi:hypothetical protein